IDLARLVDGVLAELAVNAEGRKVVMRRSIETERLHADPDLVQRRLANLVENALRYAPQGSSVTVTVARIPDGTEIRVADEGGGIELEMREKIFNAFVQVESTGPHSAARGSRGLGLTFCKLVAEAHGGRIWVEDAEPGAVFCVTFPDGS